MGQSLVFRWFGFGAMPEPVRTRVMREGPLVFVEGNRGWLRRKGRAPGGGIHGGIRSMTGAFAITPQRVVITVSSHVTVDAPLEPAPRGASVITVAPDGLRLNVDLAAAVAGGRGTMELRFKEDLSARLSHLPFRSLSLTLPQSDVVALFRAYH